MVEPTLKEEPHMEIWIPSLVGHHKEGEPHAWKHDDEEYKQNSKYYKVNPVVGYQVSKIGSNYDSNVNAIIYSSYFCQTAMVDQTFLVIYQSSDNRCTPCGWSLAPGWKSAWRKTGARSATLLRRLASRLGGCLRLQVWHRYRVTSA